MVTKRPTFVNVTGSRGISAVGIQVLSSNATGFSNHHIVPVSNTSGHPVSQVPHCPNQPAVESCNSDISYGYKVKIFNASKKSKFVVCQLHHHDEKFTSVNGIKEALNDEFAEEVPDVDSDYSVGYFEGWHHKKRWLANEEDKTLMYQK